MLSDFTNSDIVRKRRMKGILRRNFAYKDFNDGISVVEHAERAGISKGYAYCLHAEYKLWKEALEEFKKKR